MRHYVEAHRLSSRAQGLYQRARNIRQFRDGLDLQFFMHKSVEAYGFTNQLLGLSKMIPAMEALVPEELLSGSISVEALGDSPVKINAGMTEGSVRTAAVQDWLTDTADALSSFVGTADYHLAGLEKLCEEAEARFDNSNPNLSAEIYGKPWSVRMEDLENVTEALSIIGPLGASGDNSPEAYEAFNTVLLKIGGLLSGTCGMSVEVNDYGELSDQGLFCAETLARKTLAEFGYNGKSLYVLIARTRKMLAAAREVVRMRGDIIESVYNARKVYDAPSTEDHTDSLEAVSDANVIPNPEDVTTPKDDALDADALRSPKSDAFGEESFTLSITSLANYVTVLTCALDCAAHLGLVVVGIYGVAFHNVD